MRGWFPYFGEATARPSAQRTMIAALTIRPHISLASASDYTTVQTHNGLTDRIGNIGERAAEA
jgi:hypothetical protein